MRGLREEPRDRYTRADIHTLRDDMLKIVVLISI